MSLEDVLKQQTQMMIMLKGVANEVAQLKTQLPASKPFQAFQPSQPLQSFQPSQPLQSFEPSQPFQASLPGNAPPKLNYIAKPPQFTEYGDLAVATPVPTEMSQEADLAATKQDPSNTTGLYKMSNTQSLSPQEVEIRAAKNDPLYTVALFKMSTNERLSREEQQAYDKVTALATAIQGPVKVAAAKQDPLYMVAARKLGNNERLTPEEQQAFDKVKGIEVSIQTAKQIAQQVTPKQQEMQAGLPEARQDPLYMVAASKVAKNEPLTPEEQQAYDKVKDLEASIQTVEEVTNQKELTTQQEVTPQQEYEAALAATKQDPAYTGALYKMSKNERLSREEQQAYDKVKGIEASLQTLQKNQKTNQKQVTNQKTNQPQVTTQQKLTPEQDLEAAKEAAKKDPVGAYKAATVNDPLYLIAKSKADAYQRLTPEEAQALNKVEHLRIFIGTYHKVSDLEAFLGISKGKVTNQKKGGRRKRTKRARKMKPRKTYRKTNH
jgi:hypothetical protein